MIKRYSDRNWKQLRIPEQPEFWPRRTRYGDNDAQQAGLAPVEDMVDILEWGDLKDAVAEAHATQAFPMYHQSASWAPPGFRYNQDGLGYCWTWGGTGNLMDLRAAEGQETVILAPVSAGYLVGWKNQGNYLESWIQGARDFGLVPADFVEGGVNSTNRNPGSYRDGWERERQKYRLDEVWDVDTRSGDQVTIRHCITILRNGRPLYVAFNWWGHALSIVGYRWDERARFNLVPILRNSHNEDDFIELEGDRGVPDEAYGLVSSAGG